MEFVTFRKAKGKYITLFDLDLTQAILQVYQYGLHLFQYPASRQHPVHEHCHILRYRMSMESQIQGSHAYIPSRVSYQFQNPISIPKVPSSSSPPCLSLFVFFQFYASCWPDRWRGSGAWMVEHQCSQLEHQGDGTRFPPGYIRRPFW